MKNLILVLLFFITATAFATEKKLAFIVDKDGYTNVRSGQGTDKEIVGIVETGDLFYCEVSPASNWYKVTALKWDNSGAILTGYMHNSRISIVAQQPVAHQKKLIENILTRYKQLRENSDASYRKYNRATKRWNTTQDSIAHYKNRETTSQYSDAKYEPVLLGALPQYFCKTKDKETLTLFVDVLWEDIGSANEIPSFAMGDCFICAPDLIIDFLNSYENAELKELIANHIDWGLLNHFSSEDDPEYLRLKNKLGEVK